MPKPLSVWITTNCGKSFKRWEYQTTLAASWEICMQAKKQQLELDMEQQTGSKLGKECIKAVYCHPAYLTYLQSTSWDSGLDAALAGIKIVGRNINNLRYADDNIQPWCTLFPIWNQSVAPCPILTVASWPAYRFLRRQVRWSGIPISFRIFHSLLWSTQSVSKNKTGNWLWLRSWTHYCKFIFKLKSV